MGVKPLKTNDPAKHPISQPSMISMTYGLAAKPLISFREIAAWPCAADVARVRESEMAPQAIGIAQNGLGNGAGKFPFIRGSPTCFT